MSVITRTVVNKMTDGDFIVYQLDNGLNLLFTKVNGTEYVTFKEPSQTSDVLDSDNGSFETRTAKGGV